MSDHYALSFYAIRQTYTNTVTGRCWTRLLKPRWKTLAAAERNAVLHRWTSAHETSCVEVIEVAL